MAEKKKVKKKCCGKFKKKGKHCGSCPIGGEGRECKADKAYCADCDVKPDKKKNKKKKKKK
jgi:hypothetical protein